MGHDRHVVSHVVGSTSLFTTITNTIIAGTLGALIADVSGGGPAAVSIIGVLAGLGYLAAMLEIGRRSFGREPVDTRFPSPSVPKKDATRPIA
jgi:hypothetical protein